MTSERADVSEGPGDPAQPRADRPGRAEEETGKQRNTRRWNEMLQELRVAQTGVQVLTGFLLTIAFTARFADVDQTTKVAYLATLTSAIVSTGLLIAPVAFHRVLFGRGEKVWLITAANHSARGGLTLLATTVTGVMFVVFDVVVGRVEALIAAGSTLTLMAVLWLVVPLLGGER